MTTSSELAFRALVDARYRLVDRHPQLGDTATRLRILSPSDNAEHLERYKVALISANRDDIFYNPSAVVALTSDELLYSIAHIAHSMDFIADYEECDDADKLPASLAINWMVNARLRDMRLGTQPRNCMNNIAVTSSHRFGQALHIAREWMEQAKLASPGYVFG